MLDCAFEVRGCRQIELATDSHDANVGGRPFERHIEIIHPCHAGESRRMCNGRLTRMSDIISLTIPSDPRFRGVATLVLGGVGARLELPYERIDDLQLALTGALEATDGTAAVTVEIRAESDRVVVVVGPLGAGSTSDPGVERVLRPLADAVRPWLRDGGEWIELEFTRSQERDAAASS